MKKTNMILVLAVSAAMAAMTACGGSGQSAAPAATTAAAAAAKTILIFFIGNTSFYAFFNYIIVFIKMQYKIAFKTKYFMKCRLKRCFIRFVNHCLC